MLGLNSAVGRPSKYKTVEAMQIKIDEYFEACKGEIARDKDGYIIVSNRGEIQYIVQPKPPTVMGLALALGFASRDSIFDYQGKKEFSAAITRAKARCAEYAESRLFDRDGARGAEFTLRCNFGWRDKTNNETEIENRDKINALKEIFKIAEASSNVESEAK